MFSTVKEVHIYIEQAIQNIASNRKGSISPFFIDMVLNNAVLEYISSKFPNSRNPKDIESTLKKYSDFNILKSSVIKPLLVNNSLRKSVFTELPTDCLKYQTGSCNYLRPAPSNFKVNKKKYSAVLSIDDTMDFSIGDVGNWGTALTLSYKFRNQDNSLVQDYISFDDVLPKTKSKDSLFYLYDTIIDRVRNISKLDCSFKSNDKLGYKVIQIDFPVGINFMGSISNLMSSNNSFVSISYVEKDVECVIDTQGRVSQVSLLPSVEIANTLDDYYGSKNLHLNPPCELIDNNLVIYYTDFIPNKIEISYIKKPKLFDIRSGQVPQIDITKDFLDYAIKEILLILNSQSYEKVVNETIKNL